MNKKVVFGIIAGVAVAAIATKVIKDILDADKQEKEVISLEGQDEKQEIKKIKR